MLHVILKTLSTPAARTVLGLGAFATTCYMLRRTGGDKKVVECVDGVGSFATNVAVVLTGTAVDGGCAIANTAITATEVTGAAAIKAVETAGYGVGRSARFVLDTTSKAGKAASGNPLSRGVVAGFYAPEAQAQQAIPSAVQPSAC